jgi:hypothetical protein
MKSTHLRLCSAKLSLGNVYFCVNDGWVEPCDLFAVDDNICYDVPNDFNRNISAFGPDEGIACILYECVDFSVTAKGDCSPDNCWPQEL